MIKTSQKVFNKEGFLGFYRGCIPPFIGSIIFRSMQFSIFEFFYTKWESNDRLKKAIPFTGGL